MFKVQTEALREGPLTFDLDLPPGELDLQDETYKFEGKIRGQIEFRLIGNDIEGEGELRVKVVTPCVRCLEPAHLKLAIPFHEFWFKKEPEEVDRLHPDDEQFVEDEPNVSFFTGEELHPAEQMREVILSELPELPKCRDDCKGLCQGCGANLNVEECACREKPPAAHDEEAWKQKLRELRLKPEG